MCVGLIVMHIFPAQLMRVDGKPDRHQCYSSAGDHSLNFVGCWLLYRGGSGQALGNGVYSMIVSVARQMRAASGESFVLKR